MRKFKWLIAGGLLSLALVQFSFAGGDGPACKRHGHPPMPPHHGEMHQGPMHHGAKPGPMHLFLQLDLSETQYQRISELFDAEHAVMRSKHETRMELIKQLHQEANKKTLDEKRVNTLASKMGTLAKDMAVSRVKTGHRAYNLLTAEQKQKFDTMVKEKMEKKAKHPPFDKKASVEANQNIQKAVFTM